MKSRAEKTNQCPNCGQALNGENFCPACGQKNDVRRLTFWHFISESLSNFFAVDGRFFYTLRRLFRYPGKVAEEYIHGKRMQYMHPVRIYFLSSLLLLFVLQFEGCTNEIVDVNDDDPVVLNTEDQSSSELDSLLNQEEPSDWGNAPIKLNIGDEGDAEEGSLSQIIYFYEDHPDIPIEHALDSLSLENTLWNRFLAAQSAKLINFDDEEFSQYFSSKLFWVLFLYLPVLAFLLNLLYLRRKFYYPEHLFFTFYTQSAFFIIISLASIVGYMLNFNGLIAVFSLGFAVYLFLAMRRFYAQGFWKTLGKLILLNLLALPLFGAFFGLATLIAFILF